MENFACTSLPPMKEKPLSRSRKKTENLENLDIKTTQLLPERVLGIEWCIESDLLKFPVTLKDRLMTRREILSSICQLNTRSPGFRCTILTPRQENIAASM